MVSAPDSDRVNKCFPFIILLNIIYSCSACVMLLIWRPN